MNEIENMVEMPENVETTTEETVEPVVEEPAKVYTEEEFRQRLDEGIKKGVSRREAKIRKDYEKKYGGLENVLRAGTGLESVEEIEGNFRSFYEGKGIHIPTPSAYSDKDIEVLARAEAEDIINSGYEEVVEEVERLASIGVNNMNAREKAVFRTLAEHRKSAEQAKELSKIGVPESVYNSNEFKAFAAKFNSNTSPKEIYEIYNGMQPKKEIKPMGSMKSNTDNGKGVKEFYTFEEAKRFTDADYDKTPGLFEAVERSMAKW